MKDEGYVDKKNLNYKEEKFFRKWNILINEFNKNNEIIKIYSNSLFNLIFFIDHSFFYQINNLKIRSAVKQCNCFL